ncbi:MAG: hypothetical protein JST82_04970 [Bacteroidetes bacterium]|nr:hypothetical protein [Bacteroidota bacterium]
MKRLIIFIFIIASFASCEKLLMPKSSPKDAYTVFDELWNTLDKGYVYFGRNGLNWDSGAYRRFRPFINDTFYSEQLYDSCANMLALLEDPEVSLMTGFASSRYVRPNQYVSNFRKDLLDNNYLRGAQKLGPLSYNVIDSVGYIYYSDFNQPIDDDQLQVVIRSIKNNGGKKGVILDIRDCDGGDSKNMFTLFHHMGIDSATPYDYSTYLFEVSYKNGPKHDQFTDFSATWEDKNSNVKFGKKMIVLTNRRVYGIPNVFTAGSESFHNVKVMGDTTGGGASLLTAYELPNGWIIKYPYCRIRMSDGKDMRDGVAPDTVVYMKKSDEDAGKDTMIEAAIAELQKK